MTDTSKDNRTERSIQRVLRRKHSQEYFTDSGWTMDLEAARTFPDSLEAALTCARCRLSEMEMVLRIKGGTADLYCIEFYS
jgi:hypothetical protein